MAKCLLNAEGCMLPGDDFVAAWPYAEARLNGQPTEQRESALRPELPPALASWAEQDAEEIVQRLPLEQ